MPFKTNLRIDFYSQFENFGIGKSITSKSRYNFCNHHIHPDQRGEGVWGELLSSSTTLLIQTLQIISLMWNYFHWPTTNTLPFHAHPAHTITKTDRINTAFLPSFTHLRYLILWPLSQSMCQCHDSVGKILPYPLFFCQWMTTYLARVPPTPPRLKTVGFMSTLFYQKKKTLAV